MPTRAADAGNAGHGNFQHFFYYVQANDSTFDSLPTKLAAKFYRNILNPDSNLVSFPLYQADYHPDVVLKTVSFTSVRTYAACSATDPWKSYKPGRPINDITSMDVRNGYWAKLSNSDTMTVAGLLTLPVIGRMGSSRRSHIHSFSQRFKRNAWPELLHTRGKR